MDVRVVETGQDTSPVRVEDPRVGESQAQHFFVAADRQNSFSGDGQRRRPRLRRIAGPDPPVEDDQRGSGRRPGM